MDLMEPTIPSPLLEGDRSVGLRQTLGSTAASSYLPNWIPPGLSNNPYFTAGFGLIGIGAALTLLRTTLSASVAVSRRFFLSSLEIPSKDSSYSKVLQWLISRGTLTRHFGVETTQVKDESGHVRFGYDFIPSTGRHFINYQNRFLVVERQREKTMVDLTSGTPWETLTLTTFAWDRHLFSRLLEEAQRMAMKKEEGKTIIYQSFGHEWRPFGNPKRIRPFGSVILAEGVAERVIEDITSFLNSSQWYFDRGIPYRRGYLLHGPPGCGKSSYVMAAAGYLRYNICMLNIGDPYLTDDRLAYLLATVPPRALLLLEDMDSAVASFDYNAADKGHETITASKSREMRSQRASFSGLLNALDGVAATEERIIVMTANNPDILPEVLVRPGRVDLKIRIGYATPYQIYHMYCRFFPGSEEWAESFTSIIKSMQISMAELQGFFMFCKDDNEKALEMANQWKQYDDELREATLKKKEGGTEAMETEKSEDVPK